MIYMAPRTNYFFEDPEIFGCIFSVAKQVGGQIKALQAGCRWLFENGRFTGKFRESTWINYLERFQEFSDTCIGIVVPDIPFDAAGTLAEFERYHHIPKLLGYPVALVTQNGMTISDIPWAEIDTLFIGGDDLHKRGLEGQILGFEAKRFGKWVHIGRVNSGKAMLTHWTWADSADGTTLAIHPTQQFESIRNGVQSINDGTAKQLILLDT